MSANTVKSRIRVRKRAFSNTPSMTVPSSGAPFGTTADPSTVRQGMNRSRLAVREPRRACRPSEVTSTAFVRNRDGIWSL